VSVLRPRFGAASRVGGDLIAAALAFVAAFAVRVSLPLPFTSQLLPADRWQLARDSWWIPLVLQPLALYLLALYDPPSPQPRAELLRRLSIGLTLQGLVFGGFLFFSERPFPRSVVLLYLAFDLLLLYAWRRWLESSQRFVERRVAIVGRGAEALELATQIETHHWHGLKVVGFVATPDEDDTVSAPAPLGQRLGSLDDLARLMAEERIDDIIVAAPVDGWQARLIDRLGGVRRPAGSSILVLPGPWESLLGRTRYRWIRDLPLIEVVGGGRSPLAPVKRLGDLVGAASLLLLSSPILLVAMAAVRLTSRGPIFFRQERVGRDQRRFTLVKFRTMHQGAERDGEEILADLDDPRRTSVGGFLRRTRIDEIPQLWNVVRGDMSLVGPRPERPGFVERYLREVSGYAERFEVRPGVTGLAQVNGDYHSSPANKLRYDLAYIANAGLWLDLSILLRTVKIILTSRGV
jgi:exopolysaccharide biosynthesis polyprenyl glycosylphosphotransferase